jgi:hypothetical protein
MQNVNKNARRTKVKAHDIVAFLLIARTVEAKKHPVLGNVASNSRRGVTVRDAYSRCYRPTG